MIHAMFDRKRELKSNEASHEVDPFFLLREVAEMSNLKSMAESKGGELSFKQQESLANYNTFVQSNYDKLQLQQPSTGGFDIQSIEDKMKNLKFAKKEGPKDSNWFSKFSQQHDQENSTESKQRRTNMKFELTDENKRQINKEMIPHYIAKQNELIPEYQHIRNVGKELQQLKQEYGVKDLQVAPSQATTSFMNRRGSQAR